MQPPDATLIRAVKLPGVARRRNARFNGRRRRDHVRGSAAAPVMSRVAGHSYSCHVMQGGIFSRGSRSLPPLGLLLNQ